MTELNSVDDEQVDFLLAGVGLQRKVAAKDKQIAALNEQLEKVSNRLLPLLPEPTKNAQGIAGLKKQCDELRKQIAELQGGEKR